MTTDTPSFDSADDSDASYAPQSDDGVSDVEEPLDHETDLTDADELSPRDTKELDSDLDLEDQVQLFGGNVHPPDYYLRALDEFNHEAYASQDYSPGSVLLLDAMEQRWHEYVTSPTQATCADLDDSQVLQVHRPRRFRMLRVPIDRVTVHLLRLAPEPEGRQRWQGHTRNKEEELPEHILEGVSSCFRSSYRAKDRRRNEPRHAYGRNPALSISPAPVG